VSGTGRTQATGLAWGGTAGRAKGHPGKVAVASRLRQETTLSLKWIAPRLQMGRWTYVSNLLSRRPEDQAAQEVLPLCQ